MRYPRRVILVVALTLVLAGCGGSGSGRAELTVSAAASLKRAFTQYGHSFKASRVRLSFGGSDILATQIEQGVKPDVFASANLTLPQMLYAKGLTEKPVAFAANTLVLAVPAGATRLRSLADLERPGVTVAIGSPTVPVGAYTRKVLARLGGSQEKQILANVRSQEPDVSGIVGKLAQGAVDAGFTYLTDVKATAGKLRAITLPAALQPVVGYAVAIVKGGAHAAAARQFIAGLLTGAGRGDLLGAGFLPPRGQ
ncbi:MAG: molybdate ABC transporter substrate-binding protein [Actinomycetota bacterium]|nr:molybdate ABC transporter substrate-binding protein [Actinomycetota bacterium]